VSLPTPWALIAGGGTAGHTLPAVAIGQALVERGHPTDRIHFVGSARGSEAELVPAAGFGITLLPGRGIQRKLSPANVTAILGILAAFARALLLVGRRRPAVVVAMGGYASVAVAMAAVLWRVPMVVAEQNAVPGAANRLAARFARASAVAFPNTGLPREVLTGNPVRRDVRDLRDADREGCKGAVGVPSDRCLVLVFGGSLGARHLNSATLEAVDGWRERDDLTVRHVIGARDWDEFEHPDLAGSRLSYLAVRYEYDMPRALAAADLVISRAGATTVAELTTLGRPAILVPLPGAPGDHQTANARALAEAGAAVLLPDSELTGARLRSEVDALVADASRRDAMAAASRGLGRPDAADRVAELVEEHARR